MTLKQGRIVSLSGPVVTVEETEGAGMHEVCWVGPNRLVGEVIWQDGKLTVLQVYEETSGLSIGDPVVCSGRPLSVELGPGCLGGIFDGIQRPIDRIANTSKDIFIPRGTDLPTLDCSLKWQFTPLNVGIGIMVCGGDIFGNVFENNLIQHRMMVPPFIMGTVTFVAPQGRYSVEETLLEVEFQGRSHKLTMVQNWPVRQPRPVKKRLPGAVPLLTGQRVFDSIFPCAQGGTCAIPAAFGCGQGIVYWSLSRFSNTQVMIYVGCGERGNEMTEMLLEFQCMFTTVDENEESVMKRTVVVANTTNAPLAVQEASIFTGATLAEYFRDMGLDVVMMADSTSRWAEALRGLSFHLAEMPADRGYPAYLGTRLAAFYGRAGYVQCLGSPSRKGSVSIVGTVSPPGGDFSEPVTSATLASVQAFWGLDKKLAQHKHFPSINWFISHSKGIKALAPFYDNFEPEFLTLQTKLLEILRREEDLQAIVQSVGRSSLSEADKLILDTAKVIREDFLQQNAFTSYDKYCPLYKTVWMLKNIFAFYELASEAIQEPYMDITWGKVKAELAKNFSSLCDMKFQDPADGQEALTEYYQKLHTDIVAGFHSLLDW